jgi:hypothetical protein
MDDRLTVPEAAGRLVVVDRDQFHLGLDALLGQDLSQILLGVPVGRAPLEVEQFDPHVRIILARRISPTRGLEDRPL